VTLGDQPDYAIDLFATLVYFSVQATFLLIRILKILPQVFYSQPLLKKQFEFVVFVSYIVLVHFIL